MKLNQNVKLNRSTILRVAGTVITLGLLVYVLAEQGWGEIVTAVKQIPLATLSACLGLMIVSRLAVSLRWYLLLRSGGLQITPRQALRINFAGLFSNNFLPTTIGGDAVRLAGIIQLRLDAAVGAASLVVDRLAGMAGMAMMVPFGINAFLQSSGGAIQPYSGQAAFAGAAAAGLGERGKALWNRGLRIFQRLTGALVLWLKQPRALLGALAYTWAHMACTFTFMWLLFHSMKQPISFTLVGGLYSIVYLITLLPISINGYGVQEISMTFVFSHLGGVSLASALTVGILFRAFMMLVSLPGALYMPQLLQRAEKKAETGETRSES